MSAQSGYISLHASVVFVLTFVGLWLGGVGLITLLESLKSS